MEKIAISAWNKLFIVLSIITFFLSWFQKISDLYKISLLIASIILLIIIYFSPYFAAINKIENDLEEIKNEIEEIGDLINIKNDIKLLKRVCKLE